MAVRPADRTLRSLSQAVAYRSCERSTAECLLTPTIASSIEEALERVFEELIVDLAFARKGTQNKRTALAVVSRSYHDNRIGKERGKHGRSPEQVGVGGQRGRLNSV